MMLPLMLFHAADAIRCHFHISPFSFFLSATATLAGFSPLCRRFRHAASLPMPLISRAVALPPAPPIFSRHADFISLMLIAAMLIIFASHADYFRFRFFAAAMLFAALPLSPVSLIIFFALMRQITPLPPSCFFIRHYAASHDADTLFRAIAAIIHCHAVSPLIFFGCLR